jgi:hypothetical protein
MDFLFLVLRPFSDGGKGPEPETVLDARRASQYHSLSFIIYSIN